VPQFPNFVGLVELRRIVDLSKPRFKILVVEVENTADFDPVNIPAAKVGLAKVHKE
jgi:hypothetical protein